jgi:hypothetical protein
MNLSIVAKGIHFVHYIHAHECPFFYSIFLPLNYAHQKVATSLENLAANNDAVASISPFKKMTQPFDLPKPNLKLDPKLGNSLMITRVYWHISFFNFIMGCKHAKVW